MFRYVDKNPAMGILGVDRYEGCTGKGKILEKPMSFTSHHYVQLLEK